MTTDSKNIMSEANITSVENFLVRTLSGEPNTFMSVNYLHDEYCKEFGIIFPSKYFVIICECINHQFDNIIITKKNGVCFLSFSIKIKSDDEKEIENDKNENENNKDDLADEIKHQDDAEQLDGVNRIDIIEFSLKNDKYTEKLGDVDDDGNTTLHILCREGRIDLINILLDTYLETLDVKNKKDLTPLDLVDSKTSNGVEIMKRLYKELDYIRGQELNDVKNSLEEKIDVTEERKKKYLEKKAELDELDFTRKKFFAVTVVLCAIITYNYFYKCVCPL